MYQQWNYRINANESILNAIYFSACIIDLNFQWFLAAIKSQNSFFISHHISDNLNDVNCFINFKVVWVNLVIVCFQSHNWVIIMNAFSIKMIWVHLKLSSFAYIHAVVRWDLIICIISKMCCGGVLNLTYQLLFMSFDNDDVVEYLATEIQYI